MCLPSDLYGLFQFHMKITGKFGTYYGHQLISYPLFNEWLTECDNGNIANTSTCQQLRQKMNQQIQEIFTEGLDFPVCINPNNTNTDYHYAQYSKFRADWFIDQVFLYQILIHIQFVS